ncbi:hypothetical protein BDV10DRAFT_161310 [Aspergillus recurvatus]
MSDEDSLLTNLCAICHIQPPKYRCPRCSTRTCSLPCTRRHKLWSQCSGVRDPAAYLRRTELATESAFDRDFNFITSIERRLERAGRDVENRGVVIDGRQGVRELGVVGLDEDDLGQDNAGDWRKRKRAGPGAGNGNGFEKGLAKGEAGFLKRAAEARVRVIKAPRGMSRAKMNGSRWHPKQKCLQWTIEWVTDDGTKRMNCAETATVAEAYDRAFPLTREERQLRAQESTSTSELGPASAQESAKESAQDTGRDVEPDKNAESTQSQPQPQPQPQPESDIPLSKSTSEPAQKPITAADSLLSNNQPTPPLDDTAPASKPTSTLPSTELPSAHRDVFFYIHRPRAATKYPVLAPLSPESTLTTALQDRVVLEFPTIYILRSPLTPASGSARTTGTEPGHPENSNSKSKFILEAEYLGTHPGEATAGTATAGIAADEDGGEGEYKGSEDTEQALFGAGAVNIPDVDEGKMLEVLEKDLMGSG